MARDRAVQRAQVAGEGQGRRDVIFGHGLAQPRDRSDFPLVQVHEHKQRGGASERPSFGFKGIIARKKHVLGLSGPGTHRNVLVQHGILLHMQAGTAEHPRHPQPAQTLKGQIQHMAMSVPRLLHGAEDRSRLPVPGKIHRAHVQNRFIYIGFVWHATTFFPSKTGLNAKYTTVGRLFPAQISSAVLQPPTLTSPAADGKISTSPTKTLQAM